MNRISECPSCQEVKDKVQNAIELLLNHDKFLLERDVNERSISHKLASYLQEEFGNEWNVDCEYNRDHDVKKELTIHPRLLRLMIPLQQLYFLILLCIAEA